VAPYLGQGSFYFAASVDGLFHFKPSDRPLGVKNRPVCLRPQPREIIMTISDAEKYGRRAQVAGDVAEIGSAVKHAVDELVRAIRDLEVRISRLELKMK
jgi:hypothetical protein